MPNQRLVNSGIHFQYPPMPRSTDSIPVFANSSAPEYSTKFKVGMICRLEVDYFTSKKGELGKIFKIEYYGDDFDICLEMLEGKRKGLSNYMDVKHVTLIVKNNKPSWL